MEVDVEAQGVSLKSANLAADLIGVVHLRVIMVPPVRGGKVVLASHRPVGEHAVDEVVAGFVVPEDGRVHNLDAVVERRPVVE